MPEQTVRLLQNGASLRAFVENALAPDPSTEIVERILRHREATAQPFDAWAAQAAAGMGFDALGRVGGIGAPTLILHGTEDAVVDSRNAALLAVRIPDARRRALPGSGSPLLLGAARSLRRGRRGVSSVSGSLTLGRWIRDRARTTPRRVAIDFVGAETTYAELDERSERLAAGFARRPASSAATGSRR